MNSDNFERSAMENRLNKDLHSLLLPTRNRLNLTQSAMAKRYFMAKNTYWDLENVEEHGFGLLTAIMLLHMMEALAEVTILI